MKNYFYSLFIGLLLVPSFAFPRCDFIAENEYQKELERALNEDYQLRENVTPSADYFIEMIRNNERLDNQGYGKIGKFVKYINDFVIFSVLLSLKGVNAATHVFSW